MFDFMFNEFRGSDAWQNDAEKERAARRRGTVFPEDTLKAILTLWAIAQDGQARHSVDRLTIPSKTGAAIIQPTRIRFEAEPTDTQLRASMAHITDQWGGKAVIPLDPKATREFRLRSRAYAEVFGIKLDDANEAFRDLALTKAELARLPELRAAIRKAHPDAPAARPDEAEGLAATSVAKNPHRAPTPA